MAEVPNMDFTKNWTNAEDFPTHESDEEKVRADIQYLFDELKNFINQKLIAKLNGLVGSDVEVNVDTSETLDQRLTSIAEDLADLRQEIVDVTLGQVPDYSITSDKLQASLITPSKINTLESTTTDRSLTNKWALVSPPTGYPDYSSTHTVFHTVVAGTGMERFAFEKLVKIPLTYDPDFFLDIDMSWAPFNAANGILSFFPYASFDYYTIEAVKVGTGNKFRVTIPKSLYDDQGDGGSLSSEIGYLRFTVLICSY